MKKGKTHQPLKLITIILFYLAPSGRLAVSLKPGTHTRVGQEKSNKSNTTNCKMSTQDIDEEHEHNSLC